MTEPAINHPGLLRAAELAVEAEAAALRQWESCQTLAESAMAAGDSDTTQKFLVLTYKWHADAAANRARAEQYRGLVRAAEEAAAVGRAAYPRKETNDAV